MLGTSWQLSFTSFTCPSFPHAAGKTVAPVSQAVRWGWGIQWWQDAVTFLQEGTFSSILLPWIIFFCNQGDAVFLYIYIYNFNDNSNKNGYHIINTYYQPGLHQSNLYMLFLPHNYLELHILLSRFNIWGSRPRDFKYPAQVTQAAGNWLQVFVTFPFYIFSAMGDFLVKYWLSAEETVFR